MKPAKIRAVCAVLALAASALLPVAPALAQGINTGAISRDAARDANRKVEEAFERNRAYDVPAWRLSDPPPIEAFIATPALSSVQLSPDGRRIAAARRENGVTYLMLVDLDTPGATPGLLRLDDMLISSIEWGASDRILFVAGAERISYEGSDRGVVMVGAPRMYSVGLDLKNPILFFEKDKRISRENFGAPRLSGRIAGDDRHILMPMRIQFQLNLLKVDIYTGDWEVWGKGDAETVEWFVDRAGDPVIRLDRANPRGTELNVMVRENRKSGAVRWRKAQTVRVDRETSNTPDFRPLSGGRDTNQYYVQARAPGGGGIGVYLYDIEKGEIVETVFAKDHADASSVVFDPDTGAYSGTYYWEERLKFDFADPALRDRMAELDKAFQQAWNIVPVGRSRGDKRWLLQINNATNPGGFYIYDTDTRSAQEIGLLRPILAKLPAANVSAVRYAARDGLQINAYLTLPPGWKGDGARPPLIVMPHGGPEVRDTYSYNPLVQFLASRGYAVLQPNFRGSAGYGKTFQDAGLRHWGDAVQDDIADGVKFLIDNGVADPERICIFGMSYGGYSALMSAARHADLYTCVAAAAGPSELLEMLKEERKGGGSGSFAYRYWQAQIGDPDRDRDAIIAASPALQVARIDDPVLLIHGESDTTVPIEQSEIMHKALTKAAKPVEFIRIPTAAHGFRGRDQKQVFVALENFFGAHLGVAPVPPVPDPG